MSFQYSITVSNANYRTCHDKPINLKNLHLSHPNISKLYRRPSQLVFKDEKGTIVCFSNGKMRIMGCIDELEATFLAYKYSMMIDNDYNFQPIFSQSMTVAVDCKMRININMLVNEDKIAPFQYEPELFPAVLVKKFKPISINIFSSGKIIFCGVRDIQQVDDIMQELMPLLHNCQTL